ncbi:DNA adenine methylase [Candidatus Palauibacter sp.]|uniref:DNA adenine methylase n=1 Tax=Candidatus Palauibacter sp. TaxID=3101350 RepID=UPI003B525868
MPHTLDPVGPFPYQGSKRRIAPQIVRHLPRHAERFVEPFAGSAAMSLAVAARRRAAHSWINDAHEPLIILWKEILERPRALAEQYALLWNEQRGREREYFTLVRDRFNRAHDPADLLYLLARCVKAAIRYNSSGHFNNTPDHRRLGARPLEVRRRLLLASSLLEGARLTALDYAAVLRRCTSTDVIYMDPPYQGVCRSRDHRYLPKIDHDRFSEELHELRTRDLMFAVSYDGRTGDKRFGRDLPSELGLVRLEIRAGRSTQATLLGRKEVTYESLYLSPSLANAAAQSTGVPVVTQPQLL